MKERRKEGRGENRFEIEKIIQNMKKKFFFIFSNFVQGTSKTILNMFLKLKTLQNTPNNAPNCIGVSRIAISKMSKSLDYRVPNSIQLHFRASEHGGY